jgi:hypothetical protein
MALRFRYDGDAASFEAFQQQGGHGGARDCVMNGGVGPRS